MGKYLVLLSFILLTVSCEAKVEDKHMYCTQNSDCELIGTGSCCGADLSINKEFASKFKKPSRVECHTMNVLCSESVLVCKENTCSMKTKAWK
jgi:hypothetical protein